MKTDKMKPQLLLLNYVYTHSSLTIYMQTQRVTNIPLFYTLEVHVKFKISIYSATQLKCHNHPKTYTYT